MVIPVSVHALDLYKLCTQLGYMMLPKLKYAKKKNIDGYNNIDMQMIYQL